MAMAGRTTVVGVFEDRRNAEQAYDEIRALGFTDDHIGFIVRRGEGAAGTGMMEDTAGNAGEGAVTGAVVGGLIGAAAALLLPGIGPVIAGGVLATALGGAAVGAAAGGLLGALVGMGVPEEEARYYQTEFESGRTIMTVAAGNRYDEVYDVMRRHGAWDVNTRQPLKTSTGYGTGTRPTAGGEKSHDHAHSHDGDNIHSHPHAHEVGEVEEHDHSHSRGTGRQI